MAVQVLNKLTPEQAAYIAGFWDGEGSIGIWAHKRPNRKRSHYYNVRMTVSNTNLEVLEYIRDLLGSGTIHQEKVVNGNAKTLYRLCLSEGKTRQLIPQLLPYLVVKKKQAVLCLQALSVRYNGGRAGVDDETWKKQDQFHSECAKLNQRGLAHNVCRNLGLS